MTIATLRDVLQPALSGGYAIAGVVCLGWEDSRAYVHAAQAENLPIILQAGPGCRAHTPLPVLAAMFRSLAKDVDVPVVIHLDHSTDLDECCEAIDSGFTSIMYDGSRLPLAENIENTGRAAELARSNGVSAEGEIGFVGYAEGEASARTDPKEAKKFCGETGIDAVAVSVGNVHLQQDRDAEIDFDAVRAISDVCETPLVLHGGSGIPHSVRQQLARETSVCKFNIGTELRMAFGKGLREVLANDKAVFDRVKILSSLEPSLMEATQPILRGLT